MLTYSSLPPDKAAKIARLIHKGKRRPPKSSATVIQSDEQLKGYLLEKFNIRLPDVQVCPNHSTPFRAFSDAFFARRPVSVWKASRGFGGKSFLLSLLGHCEANLLSADVTILGGSGEQSQRVLEYLQRFSGDEENTKRRTHYASGGRVTALMASTRSARGPHPQRLRIDEADEMKLLLLDAAMGQPMSAGKIAKQTVLSSTHQYPDGTMTEILRRAANNAWGVYEWCWKETLEPHGWLSAAEVETKRAEVPASMWAAEYDLQEPSPENRAILPEKVDAMFRRDLGVFDGRVAEYIELEQPVAGAQYATGADWAAQKDWTIIVTLRTDVRPMLVVAWERRGRESWPSMIARFNERVRRYPSRAAHDATGIGDVVDDYQSVRADGVVLTGERRSDVFSSYIAGIENGSLVSPFIQYAERDHRYATHDDLRGSGHPPDSFVAGALAYYAAKKPRGIGFG